MTRFIGTCALLTTALWLGTGFYFTAFAANQLNAALPVDTFGQAIGALFPTFFALCTILSVLAAIFTIWLGRLTSARGGRYVMSLVLVLIGVLLNLVNQFVMLPAVQRIEAKMGPISKASADMIQQFGMTHGISMLMDMVAIVCAFLFLILLSTAVNWSWEKR